MPITPRPLKNISFRSTTHELDGKTVYGAEIYTVDGDGKEKVIVKSDVSQLAYNRQDAIVNVGLGLMQYIRFTMSRDQFDVE